jgi:hypothetical protein
MKRFLLITTLMCFVVYADATPPLSIKDPYYMYQAGISAGFNIVGKPVDGSGFSFAGMARWSNHVFGAQYEKETHSKNSFSGNYNNVHTKTGGYYSFTFPMEKFQWGPMIGVGKLTVNNRHSSNQQLVSSSTDSDTYFEMGIYGLGGARGNGIGAKVYVTFSAIEKFVGFSIFVQTGWAWNQE